MAVSYTHLDVYKRQTPRRARRPGPQALFVGSLAQKRSFFDKLYSPGFPTEKPGPCALCIIRCV